MTNEILELVSQSELNEALKLLKLSPQYKKDKVFQKQLILIENRHRASENRYNAGQVEGDSNERERNKIADSIVKLAQTLQIEGNADFITSQEILDQSSHSEIQTSLGSLLFITSNPKGVSKTPFEREFINIHTAFQNQYPTVRLKFREGVIAAEFARLIRSEQPKFLHFVGHCVEEHEDFHIAGIVLEDKRDNAQIIGFDEIATTINFALSNKPLRLAMFSASFSDVLAKKISTTGCYTIGIVRDVEDAMLIDFVGTFYSALSADLDDIPHAFACAMSEIFNDDKKRIILYKDGNIVNAF